MAPVIKASATARTTDDGSPPADTSAVNAQLYLNQIRAQAAQILLQAQNEAATIQKRAYEDGLRAAESQIKSTLDQQMTSLLPALREVIDKIDNTRQAWLANAEKTTVKLAAAIAARVIRRELDRQPEITLTLVREALEIAAGTSELKLRLHPDDHQAFASQVHKLINEVARVGKATVISDETISRGGCRIDTRFGTIDQQFEAQLARIEQELT